MINNRSEQSAADRRGRLRSVLTVAAMATCIVAGSTLAAGLLTDRPAPPAAAPFAGPSSTAGPADEPSSPAPTSSSTGTGSVEQPGTDRSSEDRSGKDRSGKDRSGKARPGEERSPGPGRPAAPEDSAPKTIEIPAIGVDTDFVPLDVAANGELETPSDPSRAGWFAGARTPGGPGVAVVAAHVTWNGAEAAFFRLGALERGDRVRVHREDGSTAVFAVQRLDTFAKDSFPTEDVYRHSNKPELVLITCGGRFDADRHYYDSNVIAWADLVDFRK